MGFTHVAPQVVEHTDGYRVFIADRYHVAYEDGSGTARVAADFEGPRWLIERATLRWVAPKDREPSAQESDLILSRIEAGLMVLSYLPKFV
jgi:hypothetical protein